MDQQTAPLVCPAHTTQYVGAVIVGIIVGAGVSFAYFSQTGGEDSYQEGWDAARARVEQSAIGGMFQTMEEIHSLYGIVTAVSGNRITIHTQSVNPFEDPALENRIITIIDDTKILKISQKDPIKFQAELEAFAKVMQSGLPAVSSAQAGKNAPQEMMPPEPFTSTPADTASIAVGNTLSVTATENIKTAKEFSASEIQIQ